MDAAERIRSTEGMVRSEESAAPAGDLAMVALVVSAQTVIKQDEELDKLEEDIRRLKNRYDQFFAGITKLPPSFERHQLESLHPRIQQAEDARQRAPLPLQHDPLALQPVPRDVGRKMREREEGPLDFRRRQAAMEAAPGGSHSRASRRVRRNVAAPDPYVKMTPGANGEEIRELYGEIERAHLETGQAVRTSSLEQLTAMIQKQSDLVREKYHVNTVAFRVETVDGKVKLKAKPLQD